MVVQLALKNAKGWKKAQKGAKVKDRWQKSAKIITTVYTAANTPQKLHKIHDNYKKKVANDPRGKQNRP